MRIPIFKTVAMPARLFWAPMMLACANFAVQMAIMVALMGAYPGAINPQFFLVSLVVVHGFLIVLGTQEPHISTLLQSWGQSCSCWKKDGTLNTDKLKPTLLPNGEGVQIKERWVKIVRLRTEGSFAADWTKWLTAMARYPVEVQVWVSNREEKLIILSAKIQKGDYRLKEALQDTLSLLAVFGPEELSDADASQIWMKILSERVKFLKTSYSLLAEDSHTYEAYIGINRLGDDMDTNMMADLLSLDGDIQLQHRIKSIPTPKANASLIQQRKLSFFTSFSQNVYNQYTKVLEAIDSVRDFSQIVTTYSVSIRIKAPTVAELEGLIVQAVAVLKQYDFQAVREKATVKAIYAGQFAAIVCAPRRYTLLSDGVVAALNTVRKGGSTGVYGGVRY